MGQYLGIAAALLSSALGGAAIGATRFVAGNVDPVALGAFRFGIGALLLLPAALLTARTPWPARRDWASTAGLGLLFFGVFPLLFNASLHYTTAARGALALSTLPLLTMVVALVMGVEPMTRRKTLGVLVAIGGVGVALLSGLRSAPPQAWLGDLLMVGGALCMAVYSVASRSVMQRSGPLTFTVVAMTVGALCLTAISVQRGGFGVVTQFGPAQWLAIAYLGIFGGAIVFFLWAFALSRTMPTLVAISVTVNPVAAALVGAVLLNEPLRWNLIVGLAGVLVGILIASTGSAGPSGSRSPSRA